MMAAAAGDRYEEREASAGRAAAMASSLVTRLGWIAAGRVSAKQG
jgi:hypothetical protein